MHAAPDVARRDRFEAAARQVWDPVQRYLLRRTDPTTAEDLLSDVLLVLWRRLDEAPPDALVPWCVGIARGCLANARRGEQRRLQLVRRLAREPLPAPVTEQDPELARALASLRPADSEVLRLWAWEGLEAKEIAVVLGCSAGAAANRLSRARAHLRAQLRQDPTAAGHRQGARGEQVTE